MKAVAEGNDAFAVDLFKRVAAGTDANVVLSPLSVRTCLAMAYAGARGETAAELRRGLHFDLPAGRLHAALSASVAALTRPAAGPARTEVANAIWAHERSPVAGSFETLTRRHYGAGLKRVDFAEPGAAAKINAWAADRTRGMIPSILDVGDLSESTRVVLANAVYFKADWA